MDDARRCRAKTKRGRCRKAAIRGGTVCRAHGGAAPQVKRKAAERLADLIDPDRVLREAAAIAYSDVRELFDERGNLRPLAAWPVDLRAAVRGFEAHPWPGAPGDMVFKIRLWDKVRALDMLMRHLALYRDRLELHVPQAEQLVAAIRAGRDRVAEAGKVAAIIPSATGGPLSRPGAEEGAEWRRRTTA